MIHMVCFYFNFRPYISIYIYIYRYSYRYACVDMCTTRNSCTGHYYVWIWGQLEIAVPVITILPLRPSFYGGLDFDWYKNFKFGNKSTDTKTP